MRKWILLILAVSLMGTALWFSSQSGRESNGFSMKVSAKIVQLIRADGDGSQDLKTVNLVVRKLAHFTEYLLLAVVLAVALILSRCRLWFAVPISWLLTVGFAFLDEQVQRGSPGRTQSVFDVMVDAAGVTVGLLAFVIVYAGVISMNTRRGGSNG